MAAEAARALDYDFSSYFGSAVPAEAPYYRPAAEPVEIPVPQERPGANVRTREAVAPSMPSVSLFAIFGVLFIGILMVFVVLAQISYNEVASETVKLNAQFRELSEQQRRLEIAFESVIDMKEVERYARDTLGMAKPDSDQTVAFRLIAIDGAEIIRDINEGKSDEGFGAFLSSLFNRLVK